MPFGTLAAEVLYQVQQTWGVNFSADDIKLTIPDRTQYRPLPLPVDMNVREALDRYRPRWHQEQDISLNLSRPFEDRSAPYIPCAMTVNVLPTLFGCGITATTAPRQQKACALPLHETSVVRLFSFTDVISLDVMI